MKQNIAKVLTFSLLATSAVFISCVDNEKNLFDAEQLRQIYEETFPVKNIDPDGDWTMSRSVTAHVTVNGDLGEDYPIRIFDANPLSPESNAKLLAEGVANRSTSFNVVMDCATALDRVFVARVDRKGHYLVQPIAIENEEVKACFGNKEGSTTCSITRTITDIPAMAAPYTDEYRTLPCLDNKNLWFAIRKMEQIYHLGGYEHFRYKLNEHPKAVDKVRLLNRMLKNKKNPLPAPNYAEEIKRQISTEGIRTINEELKKTKSAAEKIRLNEEKIYLIDNSGWSRSQRFLAKNQTYNALYGIHSQIGNDNKAVA